MKNYKIEIPRISMPTEGHGWVYCLLLNEKIVYIGQTGSRHPLGRIGQHFADKEFNSFSIKEVELSKMNEEEMRLIKQYSPKYNIVGVFRDDEFPDRLCRFDTAVEILSQIWQEDMDEGQMKRLRSILKNYTEWFETGYLIQKQKIKECSFDILRKLYWADVKKGVYKIKYRENFHRPSQHL